MTTNLSSQPNRFKQERSVLDHLVEKPFPADLSCLPETTDLWQTYRLPACHSCET